MGKITNLTPVRGISETWDVIEKLLPDIPGRVLDAGCGEHQWEADGAEITRCDNWQKYAGQRAIDEGVLNVDLQKLWPFKSKTFDGVIASDVVEHLENIWHFFREVFRVARRYVIITTPNVESAMSKQLFMEHGHLWGFHPEEREGSQHITPVFPWQVHRACDLARWHVTAWCFAHHPLGYGVARRYNITALGQAPHNQRMLVMRLEP